MKCRRLAAILMAAAMTVGTLAGCSQGQAAGQEDNPYGIDEFVMVLIPGEETEKSVQLRDNMAEEMSEAIGIPVTTYRATDYSAAVEAMRTGQAHLALLGPFSYVTARERAGAECLVVQATSGESGYQSYIVARSDSDIESLADLEGKTFAFVDPESTSGNVIPTDEIVNEFPEKELTFDDVHAEGKFFASAMYAGSHPASIQAVVQGNVDAGAVTNTTYENQIEAGNVNEEDLKVIWESPVIPGSPLAIQKDLPQELKDKVKEFLLAYDDAEYFGDPNSRYIEANDEDYDYLEELKDKYGLTD